ncbi:MAG: hypothetical protein IK111_04550 [Lachnospiraceae bacterium]|nr:hypothetical protein [Lachnospiraceae bacterium]
MGKKGFRTGLILCIAAFLAALTGCGKGETPVGYWKLTEFTENGDAVKEDDLDEYGLDGAYVVLDDDNTGYAMLFGVRADFECDPGKGCFDFEDTGAVNYGASDKKLVLADKTVTLTFEKSRDLSGDKPEGGSDETGSSETDTGNTGRSESSEDNGYFGGDWYGFIEIDSWDDSWKNMDGERYDIMAEVKMNDDGTGVMTLWDDDMPYNNPIAKVDVSSRAGLDENIGAITTEGGYFLDDEIEHADWIIDPGKSGVSDYMKIDAHYYDKGGNLAMDYTIHLKKWGADWDDLGEYPPGYDRYKEIKGESMPDKLY